MPLAIGIMVKRPLVMISAAVAREPRIRCSDNCFVDRCLATLGMTALLFERFVAAPGMTDRRETIETKWYSAIIINPVINGSARTSWFDMIMCSAVISTITASHPCNAE
jgi:hypothetical protein